MSSAQKPREVIREGAAEVKEKLRADITNWTRFRRFISLAPTMLCLDCEGTGRVPCTGCGGSGQQKLVWNDEISACPTCQGVATITCVECIGKGRVANKRRKAFLWLFAVGGLAWAIVLFRLWGGDVAPALQAKYLHGGGGGGTGQTQFAPRAKGMGIEPPGARTGVEPAGNGQPGVNGQPGGNVQPQSGGTTGATNLSEEPRGGQMRPQGGGQR